MQIENLTTDKAYIAYMSKVDHLINNLPKNGQQEIRKEIGSHLYEMLLSYPELSVETALARFGEPDAFLPEWVVLKKMELAAGSFDPIRIFRALLLGIRRHSVHAFKYILFGVLYMLTFVFAILTILKLIFPSQTGLLIHSKGFAFGFTSDINGMHEVMGWWFLPFSIFMTVFLYIIITLLLRTSLRPASKY
jgi:hypothetical protein